ncbi:Oxoglutarate and iron-dependent oxygenase degradation C-term-domain-containing protein [Scenedesmus sp. NREL 46B-D3]|nr:Oxoglutarate and iron-dependent oxygenase degradation C-term-domain-containing protein [Scenedesmus sp. NREL 46B-D3]
MADGDLANMDALDPESAAKLPALMALRGAIYSQEFRQFVEGITGVGDLSDKTDLSCNVYAQGGHLLNHDDVIGTRAVSFIIYLTDPDEPWAAEDGGALELYPLVEGSVSGDKPRFSISGWYHKATPQQGSEHASLQQLRMKAGEDQILQHTAFEGDDTSGPLSDADLALLRAWVNPAYLKQESWAKIQDKMEADGSVQLQKFLLPETLSCAFYAILGLQVADNILQAAVAQDTAEGVGSGKIPSFTAGYSEDWQAVGPPHKQRYLSYRGQPQQPAAGAAAAAAAAAASSAGGLLAAAKAALFESSAFARLLKAMIDVDILKHAGEVRRFRAGLDYTVAHYGIITSEPRLDCVLSFVDDATPAAADAWAVGEVGGFEAYLLADEDDEAAGAAAVYHQDGNDSGVINVPAASNTLNLLMRDAGLMRFVKYVSAAAPGSRWDIAMEYVPEDDGVDPPMPESPQQPAAAGKGAAAAAGNAAGGADGTA